MPANERRFFLCTGNLVTLDELHLHPAAHIIGETKRITMGGRRVSVLAVYEVSVPTTCPPEILPEIRSETKEADHIRCTVVGCGRKERWEIGYAVYLQLARRYESRIKVL
jgi:hypothetical protein